MAKVKLATSPAQSGRGMALEDLRVIRSRVRARPRQRAILPSGSFSQVRRLVDDKAQLAGVRVILVDATSSSRTCLECGHVGRESGPSQAFFRCVCCDDEANADINAARLIRTRALVNAP